MNNISINKEGATIRFNVDFYNSDIIRESIKDFSNLCDAEVTDTKKNVIVVFKNISDVTTEKLACEFCNYVLCSMKNKGLV